MKKLIVLLAFTAAVAHLKAAEEPFFQASLTPDIAIHATATPITGLCLSIWGENPQHGIALGLINGSTGESGGFTWSLLANYDDSYTGVAWATLNISKERFVGWQGGLINVANDFHGLQTGFVNYSQNLQGVQIGFVNIARNNPWFNEFPNKLALAFPFVNWSF